MGRSRVPPARRLAFAGLLALGSAAAALAADDTIFTAHIQPTFADYCVSCHGPEKTKGRLRQDSLAHMLKGGESGPAFVARDSARSSVIERMILPADDEDHMPPHDKPQPAPELVQLLQWWIDQGADAQARVGDTKIPAELAPLFASREILRPKPRAEVDAALATGAVPAVFAVRFVSLDSGGLHVSSRRASDADIERLLAVRENLLKPDLSGAPITDRCTRGHRTADEPEIPNLRRPADVTDAQQRRQLDLLRELNEAHYARHPAERDLEARIASYELAYHMQFAASDAVKLSEETAETGSLYGIDQERSRDNGSKLLLARRLVERGVRFIQAYPNDQWDAHGDLKGNHTKLCGMTDQPVAGLITDLKRRGLLETTLMIWGGEFGRLPQAQGTNGGRDHNPDGFLMWMAGGGVRAGYHHGETDEIGHRGVADAVSVPDVHATILHLLGLDHQRLTYLHNGRQFRLTDVSGQVIQRIVA